MFRRPSLHDNRLQMTVLRMMGESLCKNLDGLRRYSFLWCVNANYREQPVIHVWPLNSFGVCHSFISKVGIL